MASIPTLTPPTSSTSTTPSSTSTSTTPTSTSSTPTSTSSSTTSTSTSTSSTPSTSASSTSVSSTSSSASSSSSSTSSRPTSTPLTTSYSIATDNGQTITYTSIVAANPTSSTTTQQDNTSKPFFKNTGAVAGVFTVVGLIAVALVVVFATNTIRRRRAKRFDRDVAEAAAEAAASSHHAPVFDDDAFSGGTGGPYTGYSDGSHGAYGQPPMSHETYGMSEMASYDPYGAGAAGLGAAAVQRARTRKDSQATAGSAPGIAGFGAGSLGYPGDDGSGGQAPYHAFAGPGIPQQREGYDPARGPSLRYRRATGDIDNADPFEAAAIGGEGANIARGPSQNTMGTQYSNGQLAPRNVTTPPEGYAAHYQPGYRGDTYQPYGEQGIGSRGMSPGPSLPNPHPNSPYPPSTGHDAGADAGPFASGEFSEGDGTGEGAPRHEENRMSFQDEDDYGPRRVLKVANE